MDPWAEIDRDAVAAGSDQTIPELFARVCAAHAESSAILTPTTRLTYDGLRRRVVQAANALSSRGVRAGDRVALWLPNSPEWIVCALAITHVGAVCVPVNTRLRAPEVAHVLSTSGASLLITTDSFRSTPFLDICAGLLGEAGGGEVALPTPDYPRLREVVAIDGVRPWTTDWSRLLSGCRDDDWLDPVAAAIGRARPDDPVAMFWTSGSTGRPKGSLASHRVLGNIAAYVQIMRLTSDDVCLVSCPLFYVAGFYWCLLAPLSVGAAIRPLAHLTPGEIIDAIADERATVLIGIANAHRQLVDHPDFGHRDLTALRAMYSGGGALPVDVVRRLRSVFELDVFCTVYGLTEAGGIATMTPVSDSSELAAASIGFPLPQFDIRVVTPGTREDAVEGELLLRTPYLHVGYVPGEPVRRSDWFATGDLVRRESSGRLYFRGRTKDVVKVAGENVSPLEVESVLLAHPGVRDACVAGVPDPIRGEVVAAAVVADPNAAGGVTIGPEDILSYCKSRLAPFKQPRTVVVLDQLPSLPTGKPARTEIRELLRQAHDARLRQETT